MSREERRAYQRQMKGIERGASLPPAAKARADRNAARREARRQQGGGPSRPFNRRFLVRTALIAIAIGFIAFSLQWGDGMPRALYVGLGATAVVLVVVLGFRLLMARAQRAA